MHVEGAVGANLRAEGDVNVEMPDHGNSLDLISPVKKKRHARAFTPDSLVIRSIRSKIPS
jgi:hypothetical protein